MSMRLLIDTNVLLDYYGRRAPFFEDAKRLRVAALFGDVELWVAAQSFTGAERVLRRFAPTEVLRAMMGESLAFLSIASSSAADVEEGIRSGWPDLEDFLVARCAERARADFLLTRDEKGFARSAVPVLSPAGFFEMLERDHGIAYDEVGL